MTFSSIFSGIHVVFFTKRNLLGTPDVYYHKLTQVATKYGSHYGKTGLYMAPNDVHSFRSLQLQNCSISGRR